MNDASVAPKGLLVKLKKGWELALALMERYPWAIPLFGFVSGVASFVLVERKQDQFAQIIAVLMLASWLWLALENLLKRGVAHWFGISLPPPLLSFATQLVHQESLFFVIPFFVITTAWNSGQVVFTSLLIGAAAISLIDPLYYRWLAPRRWLYFIFHGITLFAVLLTTLPLLFYLPTPKSYLWALGIAGLLSLPQAAYFMAYSWWKKIIAGLLLIITMGSLGLAVRPWIPPASLWLTQVAITDHIDNANRSPKNRLKTITTEQLHKGLYAYTAIHAPRGLNERIYHQWRLNGQVVDKIALDIHGGREEGYRAWTHKMNFPANSVGNWQIQVLTEANQMVGVLRFRVVEPGTAIGTSHNPPASVPPTSEPPVSEPHAAPDVNTPDAAPAPTANEASASDSAPESEAETETETQPAPASSSSTDAPTQ